MVAFTLALLTGCGGIAATSTDGARPGPLTPGMCPTDVPIDGATCANIGARCSFGNGLYPSLDCRTWAECTTTGWKITPVALEPSQCVAADPICDGTDPAHMKTCSVGCHFADGTECDCYSLRIECTRPTQDVHCPPVLPNQGATCGAHATCAYGEAGGVCLPDIAFAACENDVWVLSRAPCKD